MAGAIMRAAIYCRVSSDDQRQRQTIVTQREAAQQYCARGGIEVHGIYEDDGISGTIPLEERPADARLLADARAGKFSLLVVYRLDRLGCESLVILLALQRLARLDITPLGVVEPIDLTNSSGRMMATIQSAIAQAEREAIVQRCRAGVNRVAREGH